jgi:hypothetical protein
MPVSPYCYVANGPIIAIDPDGRKIRIVGKNQDQTLQNLGALYATARGRAILDALEKSEVVYKISSGALNGKFSRHNPLNNRITYYGDGQRVDGVWNQSYIFLAHEIYHAYADEAGKKYESDDAFTAKEYEERDAMKFENYVRDVFGAGEHRTSRGGKQLLSSVSAFNSYGESIDASTVKTFISITELPGPNSSSSSTDNSNPQDETQVKYQTVINVDRILEYMDKNKKEKITINF